VVSATEMELGIQFKALGTKYKLSACRHDAGYDVNRKRLPN
jgi:hypothetical protein